MKHIVELFKIINYELLFIIIVFLTTCYLTFVSKLNQQNFVLITLFSVGYLVIRFLLSNYLTFIYQVRNTNLYPDNRSANFMTFDMLKFVLVFVSLTTIIILGLNKILNNETIATLLGGLVGSLLTMKGSYHDMQLKPEDIDRLTTRPTNTNETGN